MEWMSSWGGHAIGEGFCFELAGGSHGRPGVLLRDSRGALARAPEVQPWKLLLFLVVSLALGSVSVAAFVVVAVCSKLVFI